MPIWTIPPSYTHTHTHAHMQAQAHTHSEQHREEGGEAGRPLTKQIFGCLTLHLFLRLSATAYSSGYCPFLGSRLFGGRVQSVLGRGGVAGRTLAGLDASGQMGVWGAQRGGPVCRWLELQQLAQQIPEQKSVHYMIRIAATCAADTWTEMWALCSWNCRSLCSRYLNRNVSWNYCSILCSWYLNRKVDITLLELWQLLQQIPEQKRVLELLQQLVQLIPEQKSVRYMLGTTATCTADTWREKCVTLLELQQLAQQIPEEKSVLCSCNCSSLCSRHLNRKVCVTLLELQRFVQQIREQKSVPYTLIIISILYLPAGLPGESYGCWFTSVVLCACKVFWVLINSLFCLYSA